MLFAYGSILFFKTNKNKVSAIKSLLRIYERLLGQAVNFNKYEILFETNVRQDKPNQISSILELSKKLTNGNYLGLQSINR